MLRQTPACRSVAVIPVHNEAPTIATIVRAARAYLPVIVVDDASDDGSGQLAAGAGATVITLSRHYGKGAALRRGFAAALRYGAENVITLDGDGQHEPCDIPRFLAASRQWGSSIIIGNRLAAAPDMPRHRLRPFKSVASGLIGWASATCKSDRISPLSSHYFAVLVTEARRLSPRKRNFTQGRAGRIRHA